MLLKTKAAQTKLGIKAHESRNLGADPASHTRHSLVTDKMKSDEGNRSRKSGSKLAALHSPPDFLLCSPQKHVADFPSYRKVVYVDREAERIKVTSQLIIGINRRGAAALLSLSHAVSRRLAVWQRSFPTYSQCRPRQGSARRTRPGWQ